MAWEGYSVAWSPQADRDLSRMQPQIAASVERAAEAYALNRIGDVRPLQGRPGVYRLRVGDWRAIFTYEPAARRLAVARVLPRGRAYDR